MTSGPAIFFDGNTSARHDVTVDMLPHGLAIRDRAGGALAEWPYLQLQSLSAPDGILRLGLAGSRTLARLEILDAALAAAIDERADTIDRSGVAGRRSRRRVIGWTLAATVSLVLVAVFGIPAVIERLTPLIPLSLEHKFGVAIDAQMRAMLDTDNKSGKPFDCGDGGAVTPGRAALDKLIGRLERAAALPIPLKASVVRKSDANAIALPGGHVYVFAGLVAKAENPDELAGVIAHEIGHVAHRDSTRSVLQAAGLSFLFGMLLGDFTGGGLVVMAARTMVESAYSRDVETAADLYGVRLIAQIGGDGRALGTILERIAGAIEPGVSILLDHPQTKDRVAAINAIAPPRSGGPLLDAAEWAALKSVCG